MEEENQNNKQNQEKGWYIVVVNQNYEFKVMRDLTKLSKTNRYKDLIFRVFVPKETYETKKGQLKEKVMTGYERYVFVEMISNNETYHGVKTPSGVRHILGHPKPQPVPEEEVPLHIGGYIEHKGFEIGDRVKIISDNKGELNNSEGFIMEIDVDKGEAVVVVSQSNINSIPGDTRVQVRCYLVEISKL